MNPHAQEPHRADAPDAPDEGATEQATAPWSTKGPHWVDQSTVTRVRTPRRRPAASEPDPTPRRRTWIPWTLTALLGLSTLGIALYPHLVSDEGTLPTERMEIYLSDAPVELDQVLVTLAGVFLGDEGHELPLQVEAFDLLSYRGTQNPLLVAAGDVPAGDYDQVVFLFARADGIIGGNATPLLLPEPMLTVALGADASPEGGASLLFDINLDDSIGLTDRGFQLVPVVDHVYLQAELPAPVGSPNPTAATTYWEPLVDDPAQSTSQATSNLLPGAPWDPTQSSNGAPDAPPQNSQNGIAPLPSADHVPACDELGDACTDILPDEDHYFIAQFLPPGPSSPGTPPSNPDPDARQREIVAEFGGDLVYDFRMAPALGVRMTLAEANAMSHHPEVAYVEDGEIPIQWATFASATAATQWDALQAVAATGLVNYADLPNTGAGVGIAIIDTGVDATHPDLAFDAVGVGTPNAPVRHNFKVVGPAVVRMANSDTTGGHGTHVAGVMVGQATPAGQAAGNVGTSQRGFAPGAKLYAWGIGDANLLLWMTVAYDDLLWVLDNAGYSPAIRVVQNSWTTGTTYDASSLLSQQIADVVERGVVVVFAAGNFAGTGSVNQVSAQCQVPAEGVLCVGGFEDDDTGLRADGDAYSWSSRGLISDASTWPDLVAPATRIKSTKPVVSTTGGVATLVYATMSGTSVAAPMVSAAVALMLEADPELTPAQVERLLESTAYAFAEGGAYASSADVRYNGSHYAKGHGIVDIKAAVEAAAA